ncbi:hypothetical protein FQN60_011556, partial [Etheostoma spectabile]
MPEPILNLPLFGNGKGPSRLSFKVQASRARSSLEEICRQILQVSKQAMRWEKEGLKRSLALLEASGVTQYVWHIDKGMSKNINKLAKEKDCEMALHGIIIRFATKSVVYPFIEMLC